MSEFVSIYNVVFGTRPVKETESESGNLGAKYVLRSGEEPVDISKVVCAIEDETCKSYCFDEFGRFGEAKANDRERVKRNLAEFHKFLSFGQLGDLDRYRDQASDPDDAPEWHFYGWLLDDLPDFDAYFQQWKINNGVEGKEIPLLVLPATQSHIWKLAAKLLEISIGGEAYKAVVKGDYKQAITVLKRHGYDCEENKKKSIRRNLQEIVGQAI